MPGAGNMLTAKNNSNNANVLSQRFAEQIKKANNAEDVFKLSKQMGNALATKGVTTANQQVAIDSVFGNFNMPVPATLADAQNTDNKNNLRKTGDAFLNTDNIGDAINLTEKDFITAYGDVDGKANYVTMTNKAYIDAVNASGTLAFTPRNTQNPLSPSVTTARTAETNYKNFRKTIAEYPETVRKTVTDRYVAENKLNTKEIATYDSALKADQSQIKANISAKLSEKDYDIANLDADMQSVFGIDVNGLTGVHDLAVSQVIKYISNDESTRSLKVTADLMKDETYDDVYTEEELKRASVGIASFGKRLNTLLDDILPGATTNTKGNLLNNIETRLGFDEIRDKLDKRKKTIIATSEYFLSTAHNPFHIDSAQALISEERSDKNYPYGGDEGALLEETANSFIKAAQDKAMKEGTVNPKDYPNYSKRQLTKVALKAFSDVFVADEESFEHDDWVIATSISGFGDDEIETMGIFGNTGVDLSSGTNPRAYSEFIKRYETLLQHSKAELLEVIDSKVKK